MKIRFWFGIGFGLMDIKYSNFTDTYLVFLFVRIRIKKTKFY